MPSGGRSSPTTRATPSFAPGAPTATIWSPLWRRDGLAHAGHLIVYPDTRELVVGDWHGSRFLMRPVVAPGQPSARARFSARAGAANGAALRAAGDRLVVLDLDSGAEKARVEVPSPTQGYLFPAPGFGRDVYYQSLTTIARVVVA